MSMRDILIQEILKQPEPLLRELQHYLAFLVAHQGDETPSPKNRTPAAKVWPSGYFQKTSGAFADEPLERPPQLPFEKREVW